MAAASQAVDNASRLQELGFAEFTAKLISDVFDAIVSSNIRQQEAYAELLERVAGSVQEFEGEAVSDADVDAYLVERFPDESNPGQTRLVTGYAVPGAESDDTAVRIDDLLGAAAADAGVTLPAAGDTLEETDVDALAAATRRKLASRRLEALRDLVETGIVRLVVETGRIETRLDFTTYGADSSRSRYGSYERRKSGGSLNGGIFGSMFGISGNVGGSKVRTRTYTRNNTAYTSAKVETGATVELNLRGDYLPLREPETEE
jgi:hypothetical protein